MVFQICVVCVHVCVIPQLWDPKYGHRNTIQDLEKKDYDVVGCIRDMTLIYYHHNGIMLLSHFGSPIIKSIEMVSHFHFDTGNGCSNCSRCWFGITNILQYTLQYISSSLANNMTYSLLWVSSSILGVQSMTYCGTLPKSFVTSLQCKVHISMPQI